VIGRAASAPVVDASVATKLLLREEFSGLARALYDQSARLNEPLIAPSLFPNEVMNAVYRRLRRGLLTGDAAEEAIRLFSALSFVIISPIDLPQRAFVFARTHNLPSIYDGLYVVLAQDIGAELWTADQRLLNALGDAAP
jgi:predicted nucleic acid-binding protein